MRPASSVIAALYLLLLTAGVAQQQGRHEPVADPSTNHDASATPVEDPDTATFTRAIAGQATEEQVARFFAMTKSTETARQQAKAIVRQGSNADNSEEIISKAATLEISVYQALSDTGKLRRSFTDAQEATLKAPARKLAKSDAAVKKSAKALSRHLEEIPPDPRQLAAAVSNLERALEALQSEQRNLEKAMGIAAR